MKNKILIIDDDPIFCELIANELKSFKVSVAHNIVEAMDIIDNSMPDLIILDIMMPAGNGLMLINELIGYEDTAKIPIIICSSVAKSLNDDQFKHINVIGILDKCAMNPKDVYYITKKEFDA